MRERSSGWGSVNSEYALLEARVEWPLASKSRALLPKDDRGPEGRPNDLCIAGTPALLRSREERMPSSTAPSRKTCYNFARNNFARRARFCGQTATRVERCPHISKVLYFQTNKGRPLEFPPPCAFRFRLRAPAVPGCHSWRSLQGRAVLPARDAHHHLACVPRPR